MPQQPADSHDMIRVQGARENNLQNLTVDFPLGVFVAVTGVSPSARGWLSSAWYRPSPTRVTARGLPPSSSSSVASGTGLLSAAWSRYRDSLWPSITPTSSNCSDTAAKRGAALVCTAAGASSSGSATTRISNSSSNGFRDALNNMVSIRFRHLLPMLAALMLWLPAEAQLHRGGRTIVRGGMFVKPDSLRHKSDSLANNALTRELDSLLTLDFTADSLAVTALRTDDIRTTDSLMRLRLAGIKTEPDSMRHKKGWLMSDSMSLSKVCWLWSSFRR